MIKKIVICFLFFVSCKKEVSEKLITEIEITPEIFEFGEINMTDTLIKVFKIKNLTNNPLKIDSIGVACGCTTFRYYKEEIFKNEIVDITIQFIPNEKGVIKKAIVVEANTNPPFNMFYLKGKVN
ncbi:MAG: DUF1573 domain-containing protein [Flavobacteriaceae bacterium]|nr:DUF1573 domain-containing protein [Flavobacteriaceae bacterium]